MPFEVDGNQYEPVYGTIRNYLKEFRQEGRIKKYGKSRPACYELMESNLDKKLITHTHTGGLTVTVSHNDPFYTRLKNLPMDKQSIHDIRIRFTAPDIYEAFAINTTFPESKHSGDITLPYWNINNATVQIRIHKTNTVSIIIACSREPFPLDYNGIISFFTTLGKVHGLLVGIMLSIYSQNITNINIPSLPDWLITMWHFGRDSLIEVSGKESHVTVERANYIIERLYPKDFGKRKHRLRHELQEYPNKNPFDAINEKTEFEDNNNVDSSTKLPNLRTSLV